MKKILSIMLAVLMIAGLCTFSAFAADGIVNTTPVFNDGVATLPEDGSQSGADVNVTISGGVSHRYAVEITFNNPTFTYSTGSVWDVEKHQYVIQEADPDAWVGEGTVEIKNHSDLAVNYNVEANKVETISGYGANNLNIVLAGVDGAATSAELAACPVGATTDNVPSVGFTYTVNGKPSVSEVSAKIGEIVVTIKPVTVTEP